MVKASTSEISGNAIAETAERSIGHPYVYGVWDCSGAVNHWLSSLGLAIPGYGPGAFKGPPPHGPVVMSYATWRGASSVHGPPDPGDLCVWPGLGPGGHIGIAVSGTDMVSALDTQYGTVKTPIKGNGPAGVPLVYRRLHAVAPGTGAILPPGGCATTLVTLTAIGVTAWRTAKLLRK